MVVQLLVLVLVIQVRVRVGGVMEWSQIGQEPNGSNRRQKGSLQLSQQFLFNEQIKIVMNQYIKYNNNNFNYCPYKHKRRYTYNTQ